MINSTVLLLIWCKILVPLTWEHSEYGSEGVELEAIDDIAKVTHLYGHKDAPSGQQEDVQALCNNTQPQHSCGKSWLEQRNCKVRERKKQIHVMEVWVIRVGEWWRGCRDRRWERGEMGVGNWRKNIGKQGQRERTGEKKEGINGGDEVEKGGPVTLSPISLTFTVTGRIYGLPRDVPHPELMALCMMGWNINGFKSL